MAKKKEPMNFESILDSTVKLTPQQMRKVITNYIKENGSKKDPRFERIILSDLENRLKELNVNSHCPECGSRLIVSNGKRPNGIQRLKCQDCGKSFTYFTGTFLEKTKFPWDVWVEIVYQMLKETSTLSTQHGLIDDNFLDFVTIRTIFVWQRKIINAVEHLPQPELHGTIQVDETHYHESQKGVKEENMVSVMPDTVRKARHHYKPALYGPMGNEFATIITAVDNTGHCVGKVSGLGKFNVERFIELIHPHIQDCQWLCTDNNNVYSKYCTKFNLQHYIRPSVYTDLILGKTKDEIKRLYTLNELDYVEHRVLTYKQIEDLKVQNGLNLGRVNELHVELRTFLNKNKRGVSSKYLNAWVAWLILCKNYSVDYGHYPSSKKDAEEILSILLRQKNNIKVQDTIGKKLNLPKSVDKEMRKLMTNTDKGRLLSGRKAFVFTEEDLIEDGAIRDILYKMPLNLFREVCKHYSDLNKKRYSGYYSYTQKGRRLKYVQILEKEPDIKEQMFKITAEHGKTVLTSEEDPAHQKLSQYINE